MPELPEGKSQLSTVIDSTALESLKRLAKLEGKSQGDFIADLVIAFDAIEPSEEVDLPEDRSTVVMAVPRDRDMLKQAFANLISLAVPHMGETYILAALALARSDYQKGLPVFIEAEQMRADWARRREESTRPLSYDRKGASLK